MTETQEAPQVEARGERMRRHGRRLRLWASVTSFVVLLAILIVLISVNVRSVKLAWAFGSTHVSLVWVILVSTVLGWLLGIATSILLRYRTRRPRA